MLSDDQLGEVLRADLHTIGDELVVSPQMVDRLVPEPRVRRRWLDTVRVLAPVGVVLAAVGFAMIFVFGGSSPTPAFAVTVTRQSVHITLNQINEVAGLNREFERLGFRIRAIRMTPTCPTRLGLSYLGVAEHPASIQVSRSSPPPGVTVVIAAYQTGPNRVTEAIGTVNGAIPSCVTSHGVGPGLPGWHLLAKDRLPTGSAR